MTSTRTIQEITDSTLAEAVAATEGSLSQPQSEQLAKIIEKGILESALRMSENCQRFTVRHSGPEADIAHKINEDINRRREALLANLNGLR
ncbi:MAG: hypothetical protein C0605_08455 [Hyphomicrobiales bacterium]|nr:MAG: hypothetical protein C0605_08455 [Hyphomicrobiales bacterium]